MTAKRIRRAWPLLLPVAALLLLSAMSSPAAHAADPAPTLVFQTPLDGVTVNQPIFFFQMCFAEPINKRDPPDGGDFKFTLTAPDGLGLGHRDVYQPDAYGVSVYPGKTPGETAGQWKFTWRVTSPDGQAATEGEVNYTVDPSGEPSPQATPPPCIGEDGTATVSPTPDETVAPASPSRTLTAPGSGNPTASPGSRTPTPSPIIEGGSDDPDIDKYAFITIGAAGIAALIATAGYLIRKRVGYDPHGPTGDDDSHH